LSVTRQEKEEWNPYVGPRPFRRDLDDQNRFFGRDEETEQILSLIYGHQLVLIYAQSGAGKTSLFNAQVAPELEKNGFQVLPVARVGIGFRNENVLGILAIPDIFPEQRSGICGGSGDNIIFSRKTVYLFRVKQNQYLGRAK